MHRISMFLVTLWSTLWANYPKTLSVIDVVACSFYINYFLCTGTFLWLPTFTAISAPTRPICAFSCVPQSALTIMKASRRPLCLVRAVVRSVPTVELTIACRRLGRSAIGCSSVSSGPGVSWRFPFLLESFGTLAFRWCIYRVDIGSLTIS